MRLAKLSRGLGAVALVAALSTSMVYTAGPAQADVGLLEALWALPAAGGGVGIAAASPEVMAEAGAVCVGALVGCAVAGAAVGGMALYMTRDTWVPWVTNAFGGAPASAPVPAGFTVMLGNGERVTDLVTKVASSGVLGAVDADIRVEAMRTQYDAFPWTTTTTAFWVSASGAMHQYGPTPNVIGMVQNGYVDTNAYSFGPLAVPEGGARWVGIRTTFLANAETYGAPTQADGAHWGDVSGLGGGFDTNTATARNVVQCRNPDGSQYTVTGAPAVINGLVEFPTCTGAPGSQPGAHGECYTLSAAPPGAPADWTPQSSTCGAAAAANIKYPNCVGGTVGCTYVIRVNGLPCTVGGLGCADWPAQAETNPANYECFWGPYAVPLASCNVLERAYEPGHTATGVGSVPATLANTDGDPRTYTAPVPAIAPPGTARVPAPTTDPAPNPNDPKPCTSGQACRIAPVAGQDCYPNGYGAFSPVEWVLMPVKCALSWAFVPPAGSLDGPIQDFKNTWSTRPPGSLVVGASTVFASMGSGWNGSCSGSASASFSQPALGHPLQLPCTPTGGGSGTVPYTAMQIALIVFTLIGVWHMVAAGISAQNTGGDG